MLAKNVNDHACCLDERGACEFFASKLAPAHRASQFFSARASSPSATAACRRCCEIAGSYGSGR
ncbi:hypothetical protein CYL20_21405 [Pseudomonas palleroniana]|uniref:Uncharacterized protein n=1 Tax=Pseudomonas palleroniana TaxID=191390 RepID=A0A2L1JEU5_9PSED|nr:hypothetical protein CYL20_21405 [Pseudomonas palleroniana]